MKRTVEIKGLKRGLYIQIDQEAALSDILENLDRILPGVELYRHSEFIGTRGKVLSYKEKAEIEEVLIKHIGRPPLSLEIVPPTTRTPSEIKIEEEVSKRVLAAYENEYGPKIKKLESELEMERQRNASLNDAVPEGAVAAAADDDYVEKRKNHVLIHYGTLRSGGSLRNKGDIVIIGDINAGAEAVSEGNIICIGKALGLVNAGAAGKKDAFILALHLAPTQIRITNLLAGPAAGKKYKPKDVPQVARIVNGKIKIEEV